MKTVQGSQFDMNLGKGRRGCTGFGKMMKDNTKVTTFLQHATKIATTAPNLREDKVRTQQNQRVTEITS